MLLLFRLTSLTLIAVTWFETTLGETKLGLVSRRNQVRKLAADAYGTGHYREALTHYRYLLSTAPAPAPGERLNLGHTLFRLGRYKAAKQQYEKAGTAATPALSASAATQLGVLASLEKDTTLALLQFRRALLSDPDNAVARQNYELLALSFSGRKPVPQAVRQVAKPRPQPSVSPGRAERTEQRQDRLNRANNATLSDEQARQLLDALQADDLPYELARRRANRQPAGNRTGRW